MSTTPNLEDFIPDGNWRADEAGSGDLRRFVVDVLQPALDLAAEDATRWEVQPDPDQADSDSVDAMLADLGNPFEVALSLSLARRRLLVRSLVDSYKLNGTEPGLTAIVRALTGVEVVDVISPAEISGWILGLSVLGDTVDDPEPELAITDRAVLGPHPEFSAYSFQVEVDQVITADERATITAIARAVKPAHTHFVGVLEPGDLPEPDHWQLGRSALGTESDLHDTP